MASKQSLKLVLNENTGEVLFGEAGKDFIDFLFTLLALPMGYVAKLLTKQHMVGCTGNLYSSLKNLSSDYMQPNFDKNTLLNPKMPIPMSGQNPLLLLQDAASSTKSKNYSYPHTSVSFGPHTHSVLSFGSSVSAFGVASGSDGGGGCVKGVVTYMVMDDLVVTPMSTISSISLLNKYQVKDVSALKEKVVEVGMNEDLAQESKTTFTGAFRAKARRHGVAGKDSTL
ncbi:uncharacterized protein LOC131243598 isoform X11 [Magnolia sinica]|uniref:uncharacterized protein LOC131243598 isoform X11 n=1 Tax=Magnolia sinica TaxID=86752 RepID=UPI00265AE3DC|nr:uncharacterized protein LOC131243598 isoform X11 [Magnolia sinica]